MPDVPIPDYGPDVLRDDAAAFALEWLVADGAGGYASGTLGGPATRRYHGLMAAAFAPPCGRAMLLSRLEDTVALRGADAPPAELSANLYPGAVHPTGNRLLTRFSLFPHPTWEYAIAPGVTVTRSVCCPAAGVREIVWRLQADATDAVADLRLVPLFAWRPLNNEMMATDAVPEVSWSPSTGALTVMLPPIDGATDHPVPLTVQLAADFAAFEPGAAWYYRFQHPRDSERGYDGSEDLWTPGTLACTLSPASPARITASVNGSVVPQGGRASARADACTAAHTLRRAADAFVVGGEGVRASVVAGYHWFADWGRDTMIALPGLCLATGRHDTAREILTTWAAAESNGLLPNRFPESGEAEYNTMDATLWFLVALHRWREATGDGSLMQELWPVLSRIADAHFDGTLHGIGRDPADGLLRGGDESTQLTWMDAVVDGRPVTPRAGKPVEVNALWCAALRILAQAAADRGDAAAKAKWGGAADDAAAGFLRRFVRPDGLGLYDVVDTPGGTPDGSLRPNQVFAVSLPFAPLAANSAEARAVVTVVRERLATPCGLRTLAPDDPRYRGRYAGAQPERDAAYHNGTVWPWLQGAWAEAVAAVDGSPAAGVAVLEPLFGRVREYGVGYLPEVYDGDAPHAPGGCIAQAWSVAEPLRAWCALSGQDP